VHEQRAPAREIAVSAWVLSEQSLTRFADTVFDQARHNLARDGFVATAVLGVGRGEGLLRILEAPADHPVETRGPYAILMPGPLRDRSEQIRDLFTQRKVQAAVWVGEFWSFPADDLHAPQRFLAGDGPSPSQHPRRIEGVGVGMAWPLGGLNRWSSAQIHRAGGRAYTRAATVTVDRGVDPTSLMLTSWLEGVLPAPGEPVAPGST
jgi:hypothetical protein